MKNCLLKKTMTKFEISFIFILVVLCFIIFGGLTVLKIGFHGSIIRGTSMEKTISNNSKAISVSSSLRELERGDIVSIYAYSKGESIGLCKRIIGLPSETIKIKGNNVYINEVLLEEPYAYYDMESIDDFEYVLKENEYYVLGDNRLHSGDSREFGPVPRENITRLYLLYR